MERHQFAFAVFSAEAIQQMPYEWLGQQLRAAQESGVGTIEIVATDAEVEERVAQMNGMVGLVVQDAGEAESDVTDDLDVTPEQAAEILRPRFKDA